MSQLSPSYRQVKKILIVGFGSIGKRHAKIIRELYPEILIAVLRHGDCNGDEMDSLGIKHCFTQYEDVLLFQPDAAIVANPAPMHLDIAIRLAEAGVHLMIEKPIAANIEGVDELIALSSQKSLVLMTAYNLRFLPSLNFFRKYIQSSEIGEVFSVRAEVGQNLRNWRPESDYRKSVSAQYKLGGGVLLELSHEIDYLLWIFGSVEWVVGHISKQSDLEVDVEDAAHIILGFESHEKKPANLVATLSMDFFRHDNMRQCTVIGEKGTLRWDGVAGLVEYFPKNGQAWGILHQGKPDRNYSYSEELKHFVFSIESSKKPMISGIDGLKVLTVISAIQESSRINQRVALDIL